MLPRASRLKRSRDFQAVYKRRTSWASPNLVLYVRFRTPREPESSRLGIVISKKVAKRAHDRNRMKRLGLLPAALRPFDALVVARTSAPALGYAQLLQELTGLARQGGLVKEVQI